MAGGRPCELTDHVQRIICKALAEGNVREHAALEAGIAPRTLFRWIRKGKAAKGGKFRQFWHAVVAAEAKAVRLFLKAIRDAALGYNEKQVKVREHPDGTKTTETTTRRVIHPEFAWRWLRTRFPEHYGDDKHVIKEIQKLLKERDASAQAHIPPSQPRG